ncbi:MAG: type II secretion system protein GspL [Comamonas sp.]
MSTLILTLPMPDGAEALYSYTLSPDGRSMAQHGSTTAALLPHPGRAGETVAVVPARLLSWHRVTLPQGVSAQSPRLRAVLEGLLEEWLLDEPGQLHFALQPQAHAGAPVWVATCPRAWLREHLQALEAAGRAIGRIVPSHTPDTPSPDGATVLVTGTPEAAQALCYGLGEAVVPLPLTRETAALLPASTPDTPPVHAEPAVVAVAEQLLGRPVQLYSAAQTMLDAAASDWDLAQLDFANSGRQRMQRRLGSGLNDVLHAPAWRPARWGALALAVVALVGVNARAWQERQQLKAKQTMVRNILTTSFPKVQVVVDAPMQMAREVALLRQASGGLTPGDLEPLLAAAGEALTALPPGSMPSQIEYANHELRLRGLPAASLDAFRGRLQTQGAQVDVQNDQWVVREARQ